jgi:hypothetical protein
MKLDEQSIILETVGGSHAYGTNIETSDLDTRGIFIAERDFYHGFSKNVEQIEMKGELDRVIYELRKFMKLAANCNPNILEILFGRDKDIIKITKLGEKLREHRDLFLSKKCKHAYLGYAHAQLKRIKSHKKWLLDPPKKKPEREDFDLPKYKKLVPKDWISAISQSDYSVLENKIDKDYEFLIDAAKKEKSYHDALTHWKQYINWKETRNSKRAALEAKWGFDTKHANHLVRMMRTCIELLEGRGLLVYRHDAEELLDIRHGVWSYDKLIDEAQKLEAHANELYETSNLRHHVDIEKLNELCMELVEGSLNE